MSGIISRIGSNIGTLAARATGLAAVGMVGYDAHVIGKLTSDTYSQSREANRLSYAANNDAYLDSPSAVMGKVKKKIFNFQLENNIFMPIEAAIGYFKGFGGMCLENGLPLGLGVLATLAKGKIIPRLSALGLLMIGGYKVLHDGFGVGRPERLNSAFK